MNKKNYSIEDFATNYKFISKKFTFLNVKKTHKLSNAKVSLKTSERLIKEIKFLPKKVKKDELLDEYSRPLKKQIKCYWEEKARKKRITELICFLSSFKSKQYLFVQDKRGSLNWIEIEDEEFENDKEILKIFKEILKIYSGDIFIWPNGKATKFFRKYLSTKDTEKTFFGRRSIIIPLSSYNSCFKSGLELQKNFFLNTNFNSTKLNNSSQLSLLEAESIHIMREVISESKNPVMLYSLGKDSSVMLHLAKKAFFPGKLPFPLLHVDTKWKFKEMYEFRNYIEKKIDSELIIFSNQEGLDRNINPIEHGSSLHTNIMKTEALKKALDKYNFDFAFGGARRDEEKSRAKERIFSLRNETHSWDPKNQRPELWNKYNCKIGPNENVRVFPLSNWTEIDIWHYIYKEKIELIPLYFSRPRPVTYLGETMILVDDERLNVTNEKIQIKNVRFRTLGCYPLSGAIESNAQNLESVIKEIIDSNFEERQGRTIDKDSDSSMEKKKVEGYF